MRAQEYAGLSRPSLVKERIPTIEPRNGVDHSQPKPSAEALQRISQYVICLIDAILPAAPWRRGAGAEQKVMQLGDT